MELKEELKIEEEKIEKMKKAKRALAAKQRLLVKRQQQEVSATGITTVPSPQLSSDEITALPLPPRRCTGDLIEVEANLTATKNAIQDQQKLVDAGRQRLKMYLGKQQQLLKGGGVSVSKQQQASFDSNLIFLPSSSSSVSPQYYSKIQQSSFETNIVDQKVQFLPRNSFDQSVTDSFQPLKPTRGRKRKKVFLINWACRIVTGRVICFLFLSFLISFFISNIILHD
jgi:hypothetical protein